MPSCFTGFILLTWAFAAYFILAWLGWLPWLRIRTGYGWWRRDRGTRTATGQVAPTGRMGADRRVIRDFALAPATVGHEA